MFKNSLFSDELLNTIKNICNSKPEVKPTDIKVEEEIKETPEKQVVSEEDKTATRLEIKQNKEQIDLLKKSCKTYEILYKKYEAQVKKIDVEMTKKEEQFKKIQEKFEKEIRELDLKYNEASTPKDKAFANLTRCKEQISELEKKNQELKAELAPPVKEEKDEKEEKESTEELKKEE